ncbi:Mu-like prophage major head subunit gpT family protein [Tabrizicola sp. YIM 78059]|uniref:phage major capsid protein n=1 Tax=Tabrizicola sp. YIM 78059 TaxID=2529861 RepID=UPI0010A9FBB3|nr:Mu-like prophage major head subunit gpT family protein [Tabrizicola sp. YIM 78059]
MLDETQTPPARLVAQLRVVAKAKGLPDDLADAAAKAGWTPEAFTAAAPMLKRRAQVGAVLFKGQDNPTLELMAEAMAEESEPVALEALIADKVAQVQIEATGSNVPMFGAPTDRSLAGARESLVPRMVAGLVARLDPKSPEAQKGGEFARTTLDEIAMTVCRSNGLRPASREGAIRMAVHSTSDFPLILADSVANLAARRIEQRMPDLARASREIPRSDYRAGNLLTLSATGAPQEVGEGGEIQSVTAQEKGEALPRLRDFASMFSISNQALVNDRLDLLTNIADQMARGAIERLRAVLLAPILANSGAGQTMADGQPMWHASHGNLIASGSGLTVTNLSAMRTKMRKMTGLNGEILAIEPWALVVPAELETMAQQLIAKINATTSDDANPFSGGLEVIVEPGLTDPLAWYLIADPMRHDGLAHAFLDGQRMPRIESRPGWNTLGVDFRLTWQLDAKFIETATWIKNPGSGG